MDISLATDVFRLILKGTNFPICSLPPLRNRSPPVTGAYVEMLRTFCHVLSLPIQPASSTYMAIVRQAQLAIYLSRSSFFLPLYPLCCILPVQMSFSPPVVVLLFFSRFALVQEQIDSITTGSGTKIWTGAESIPFSPLPYPEQGTRTMCFCL